MKQEKAPKHVVIIGGAGGSSTIVKALRPLNARITLIQTPSDDGGSGGAMRNYFNMMAPGDTRRALLMLSGLSDEAFFEAFKHRYENGPLKGQVVGNLVLAGLHELHNNFEKVIEASKSIFRVEGDIIPASLRPSTLHAELENGTVISGETNIDVPKHDGSLRITRVWLQPSVRANPKALTALNHADLIVIGPGDLYTSIIPNLLVSGIPAAIKRSPAKKVFVVNNATKYGETHNFAASDFVNAITQYLGKGVLDAVVVNTYTTNAKGKALNTRGSVFTKADTENFEATITPITGAFARTDKPAWFDPARLTPVLKQLL